MSWGEKMRPDDDAATVRAPGGLQKPAAKTDVQLIWEKLKALFPDQVTLKEDGTSSIKAQIANINYDRQNNSWVIFTSGPSLQMGFSRSNFTDPKIAGLTFEEKQKEDVETSGFAQAKGDFYKEDVVKFRFDDAALKQGLGIGDSRLR